MEVEVFCYLINDAYFSNKIGFLKGLTIFLERFLSILDF